MNILGFNLNINFGSIMLWAIIILVLAAVAVIVYIAFQRKKHNIKCIVLERRANSVNPSVDWGHFYRNEEKIYFHLWNKKINIQPQGFKEIHIQSLNNKTLSQIIFLKLGPDDYKVADIDFQDGIITPIDNDVRMHFVESWKEAFNKYLNKGLNRYLPIIMMVVIGFIFIIGLFVVGNKITESTKNLGESMKVVSADLVKVSENLKVGAENTNKVATALGITLANTSAPITQPKG